MLNFQLEKGRKNNQNKIIKIILMYSRIFLSNTRRSYGLANLGWFHYLKSVPDIAMYNKDM